MTEEIGIKIKRAMQEANLTQAELAKKIGIKKQQQISKWVTDKSTPKAPTLKKIAEATGKPLNYFFENSNMVTGNHNILGNQNNGLNPSEFALLQKDVELIRKDNQLLNKDVELLKKKWKISN
ncbi:transcriptional regulator with XRE-family HTH domain [Elusimicrobium posterum]|uniref:helix-turn-helix domain-containing protein n=1 Tax=Elusimicrobium posterum TaxID=3116653 RepID=UPI003C730245